MHCTHTQNKTLKADRVDILINSFYSLTDESYFSEWIWLSMLNTIESVEKKIVTLRREKKIIRSPACDG